MKTITFKPEFEKKLKELKVKTKFVNVIAVHNHKIHMLVRERVDIINDCESFRDFIRSGFIWSESKEGFFFWHDIAKS